MYVNLTVKENLSGSYDVFKNGNIVQRRVPFEKLEAAMSPHHVKGQSWQNLLTQLESSREGTVSIDSSSTREAQNSQSP
jgi:hypothetical protein